MLLALSLAALLTAPDLDTTFAVQRGQRLEVNAHAGDIVVRTWTRNAVRVQAMGGSRARIQIDQSASLVSIHGTGRRGTPASIDFELTVPVWMGLRLSGVNTTMRVTGVESGITVETVDGDVEVTGGSGLVSLRSVQGAVTLAGARGKIDVNSVNSDVTVHDVSGDLQAETVNGEVRLDRIQSDNVEANTVNGDIDYAGTIRASGRYRFATHNGDVTVVIPEGTSALVSVSTFQGEFESSFPVTLTERRGKRFDFTLGAGSARIELESFGGTIRLVRPGPRQERRQSDDDKDPESEE